MKTINKISLMLALGATLVGGVIYADQGSKTEATVAAATCDASNTQECDPTLAIQNNVKNKKSSVAKIAVPVAGAIATIAAAATACVAYAGSLSPAALLLLAVAL